MASEQECDDAFRLLAELLQAVDPAVRKKYVIDRTVSCKVNDLGVTWSARLCDDGLLGIARDTETKAQIRFSLNSDDLLALVAGRQPVPSAFATGRLRVQAGPLDMLRLTSLSSLGGLNNSQP